MIFYEMQVVHLISTRILLQSIYIWRKIIISPLSSR